MTSILLKCWVNSLPNNMRLRYIIIVILITFSFTAYDSVQAEQGYVGLPDAAGTQTELPSTNQEWVDACTQLSCGGQTVEENCSAFAANPLQTPEGKYYCLTVPCSGKTCYYVERKCNSSEDCAGYGQYQACSNNYCYLDEAGKKKFESQPSLFGITADLQIKKPILEINIPQLKFSDVQNTVDSQGFIHIPYIGEYISAIYKVAMVIVSIVGVVMIIVVGIKVTVMGGEERINGLKKIGQVTIGLVIAWGSYAILYNINPDLVNFKSLKVQYIKPEELPDITENDYADGSPGTPERLCSSREECAPYCSKKTPLPEASSGMAKPSELIDVNKWFDSHDPSHKGLIIRKGAMLQPFAMIPLQKAGQNAAGKGYVLKIQSTYRPLADQMGKYCNHFLPPDFTTDKKDDPYKPSELAWPGGSNHGAGIAMDVTLLESGKPVAGYGKKDETGTPLQDLKQIMYTAGWVRLKSEVWHYEFWGSTPFPTATRCDNC